MKRLYIIALSALMCFSASAQNLRTGYFLDGYSYRYQFNPAFQGDRGFFAMPFLSRMSLGAETSIALKDFLYPTSSGTLGTFLHPDVPDEVVLRNLGKRTMANTNVDLNILGLGFRVKKTYHTLDLSLKANADMTLPGDIFRFMKIGGSDGNAVYNLADLGVSSDAYAQLAYGFSRRFMDKFNIGIRVKALMGIESVRTNIRSLSLKMDRDQWMATADGSAVLSSLISSSMTDEGMDFTDNLITLVKTPNLGFALDLGASVDLFKYLTLSVSVLDLGFISWKNTGVYTLASEPWVYEGFEFSAADSESNNMDSQFEAKLNELKALFNFEDIKPELKDKYRQQLAMTLHVGLEARLPFYERLSLGALATHRFRGSHSWTEGRFSVNWALLRWFSLAANYAVSDFGHSFGGAVNLHPKGFSLFLGTDSFRPFTSFSPAMVPLNDLNTNLVFGVNFPFGKYNGRFPKKIKEKKNKKDGDDRIPQAD